MTTESILTRELAIVAGDVPTPPAPAVADLVHEAEAVLRRSRRRKALAASGLVAAAVLGAVLAGAHLGDPDAAPVPAPQPTGDPTTLTTGVPIQTWVDKRGLLHLDGVTVPGADYAAAVRAGDLTTAAVGPYDTGEAAVFLGTERVGTVQDVYEAASILSSPDHRTIAYVGYENPRRTALSIVVARVSADGVQELGRLPLDSLSAGVDDESREQLFDVADDGTVRYGGVMGGHRWTPGSEPVATDIPEQTYGPSGFPSSAQDIRRDPSGAWGAWQTDEVPPPTPDDGFTYRSVTVQQPGVPRSRHTFSFADRYAYANIVFWETETALIVYADHNPPGQTSDGEYLRCDVVDRRCEVAPEPGAG